VAPPIRIPGYVTAGIRIFGLEGPLQTTPVNPRLTEWNDASEQDERAFIRWQVLSPTPDDP